MTTHKHAVRTFEPALMGRRWSIRSKRMTPMAQWRNPVMFVTWMGALLTTVLGDRRSATDSRLRSRSGCG